MKNLENPHEPSIKRSIDRKIKDLIPDKYALCGDNNRLMITSDKFSSLVEENAIAYTKYFTQLFGVGPNSDRYENYVDKTHVIVSLPGALQQTFHQDTNKHDHIIMIHAIKRRYTVLLLVVG